MESSSRKSEIAELIQSGDRERISCWYRKIAAKLEGQEVSYPETAREREELGGVLLQIWDYRAAALEIEGALRLHRQNDKSISPDAARCLTYIGRCYLYTGRPVEAELALCEALTILDHLPTDQQGARGFVLVDLAIFHTRNKGFSEAERLLHEAARQHLHYFGYGNVHFAFAFMQLSVTYALQGKFQAAEKTLGKAFRALRFAGGADDAGYAFFLKTRGQLFAAMSRIDAARETYREATAFLQQIDKPRHFLLDELMRLIEKLGPNAGGCSNPSSPPSSVRPREPATPTA
jgi:tetratricopeptide (TPR) repeat protein